MKENVILIFDIGKTNKKVLVFNEQGEVLDSYLESIPEIQDEDAYSCDDLEAIVAWIRFQYGLLKAHEKYQVKAINFATYGATLVHLDAHNETILPIYNYLKPFANELKEQLLHLYFNDNQSEFSIQTSSPFMGMLNSGLQLYWLKHSKPDKYDQIKTSLHLPQYLSFLFSNQKVSDYSSIGCHTGLYDFKNKTYHQWVTAEGIDKKLAPIVGPTFFATSDDIFVGAGLHDSSSALIPYLQEYKEPFILISTGTWSMQINPFNSTALTEKELSKDCLSFLKADGTPVKTSRIFLGKEHEMQCERIATHFKVPTDFYLKASFSDEIAIALPPYYPLCLAGTGPVPEPQDKLWDLSIFSSSVVAYQNLVYHLIELLQLSINLVDNAQVQNIFVDGGFASNQIFIHYLQQAYPTKKVETIGFAQATALGAFHQIAALLKK